MRVTHCLRDKSRPTETPVVTFAHWTDRGRHYQLKLSSGVELGHGGETTGNSAPHTRSASGDDRVGRNPCPVVVRAGARPMPGRIDRAGDCVAGPTTLPTTYQHPPARTPCHGYAGPMPGSTGCYADAMTRDGEGARHKSGFPLRSSLPRLTRHR